jgi:3D (Asp-Asp-Asp) domain-containing protein
MKKALAIIASLLMLSPLTVSAEDEIAGSLPLVRTTVYYAHEGAKTATGKTARYGMVAYDPAYFGKTCILYTEDMRYIGIFECEDTGGHRVRTGQVLDVYCPTRQACYDWVAENGMYCYVQWIDSEG